MEGNCRTARRQGPRAAAIIKLLFNRLWARGWRRSDSVLALALIILSGLVIDGANRLPPPFFDPLGSAAVPRFIAGLLIILAGCLIVRCLSEPLPAEGDRAGDEDRSAPWVALGSVAVPVVYVLAMQAGFLGFAPASSLFVLVEGAILSRGRWRVVAILVPVALLTGYGLNMLLTQVFFIDLPQQSFWSETP